MDRIAVLLGGDSPERDVSLVSGNEVIKELTNLGFEPIGIDPAESNSVDMLLSRLRDLKPRLVFNALHGGNGENGQLTAALDMAGFTCTGSNYKASCLAMDKYISKLLAGAEGLPLARHILIRGDLLGDYQDPVDYQGIVTALGLPVIVKPNDAGSSVGISRVESLHELKPAVSEALRYCNEVLLEEYIEGREITVTILDSTALPVVEIKPLNGWYDYTNKYTKGKTEYLAPAPITEAEKQLSQLYAERIFKALGCSGYARVDFRLKAGVPYFLEVNTLPGMTPLSLTPMAARAAGISFGELLSRIINISLRN